jgi:hypothetical protein
MPVDGMMWMDGTVRNTRYSHNETIKEKRCWCLSEYAANNEITQAIQKLVVGVDSRCKILCTWELGCGVDCWCGENNAFETLIPIFYYSYCVCNYV